MFVRAHAKQKGNYIVKIILSSKNRFKYNQPIVLQIIFMPIYLYLRNLLTFFLSTINPNSFLYKPIYTNYIGNTILILLV